MISLHRCDTFWFLEFNDDVLNQSRTWATATFLRCVRYDSNMHSKKESKAPRDPRRPQDIKNSIEEASKLENWGLTSDLISHQFSDRFFDGFGIAPGDPQEPPETGQQGFKTIPRPTQEGPRPFQEAQELTKELQERHMRLFCFYFVLFVFYLF